MSIFTVLANSQQANFNTDAASLAPKAQRSPFSPYVTRTAIQTVAKGRTDGLPAYGGLARVGSPRPLRNILAGALNFFF